MDMRKTKVIFNNSLAGQQLMSGNETRERVDSVEEYTNLGYRTRLLQTPPTRNTSEREQEWDAVLLVNTVNK